MKEDAVVLKSKLTAEELAVLKSEMEKFKKSIGLAYVLWVFLGTLGIHQFYMGRHGRGGLYLALGMILWLELAYFFLILGRATGVLIFGVICFAALTVFLLVDLFSIPSQLRKEFEVREIKALKRIRNSPKMEDR